AEVSAIEQIAPTTAVVQTADAPAVEPAHTKAPILELEDYSHNERAREITNPQATEPKQASQPDQPIIEAIKATTPIEPATFNAQTAIGSNHQTASQVISHSEEGIQVMAPLEDTDEEPARRRLRPAQPAHLTVHAPTTTANGPSRIASVFAPTFS